MLKEKSNDSQRIYHIQCLGGINNIYLISRLLFAHLIKCLNHKDILSK